MTDRESYASRPGAYMEQLREAYTFGNPPEVMFQQKGTYAPTPSGRPTSEADGDQYMVAKGGDYTKAVKQPGYHAPPSPSCNVLC